MKRTLAMLLTLVLCFSVLASCRRSYKENTFFDKDFLHENKLHDMPIPVHVDSSVIQYGSILYLDLSKDEYESYIGELLSYLRAKKDILYLGYSVGSYLMAEMLQYDEIAPLTDKYDVSDTDHDFFFSRDGGLDERGYLNTPVEIQITRKSGILRAKNFKYNTQISIIDGISAKAFWNLCGAEHTFDGGVEYKIPGSDSTVTEYTCVHCGHAELSDFIGDMKFYNITIEDTDADHCLLNRRDSAVSGVIVEFKTHKIIDADLRFLVNGTEITPRETNDGYWLYTFIMPCEDITIITDIVGGSPSLS